MVALGRCGWQGFPPRPMWAAMCFADFARKLADLAQHLWVAGGCVAWYICSLWWCTFHIQVGVAFGFWAQGFLEHWLCLGCFGGMPRLFEPGYA